MFKLSHSLKYLVLCALFGMTSCATQSANQYLKPFDTIKYRSMRVDPCVDRTGIVSTRDLSKEANQSLYEEISSIGLFAVKPDGDLTLSCDIERFVEGSALKRWLWPGWGATKAKITVMVWERSSQTVLAILSSVATVESGGLYTIGADHYIMEVAIKDIISKIKRWSQGKK